MRTALATALLLCFVGTAWAGKPLPEKAKLDAAKVVARDRYFKELKKADADGLKTFLDAADATIDDDARQAALYFVVSEAAVEGGNFTVALEALDRLGRNFDYDALTGKLKLLDTASKSTKQADARAKLVNRVLELIEEAMIAERLDVAEDAAKLGESIATRLRDARLRKELTGKRTRIEMQRRDNRTEADALTRAEDVLKADPNDPIANRLLGIKLAGDEKLPEALPHLALADDGDVRAAAKGETDHPDEPARQLALADAWWQIADSVENDKQRAAFRARAIYWYSRALAGLDGMPRTRASQRIKFSGEKTVAAAVSQTSGDDNTTDIVLAVGVTLRLVRIPSAGNEKIKSFWLGQTELTEGQWLAVMNGVASKKDLPKVLVSFNECRVMLEKLNASPTGRRYHFRLPSREEFAHACGNLSTYRGEMGDYAWLYDASPQQVQPVARKKPNPFGLYDILGNVWEFAADGRFYGWSAWETEKSIPGDFTSIELPDNYTGTRADFVGANLGVRIAADLR